MLSKILGIIWIVLGILWLLKPASLRDRLKRKMNRKVKRIIFGFILVLGFLMIGATFKAHGFLPKLIGIIGAIIAIKGIILITSKSSEKVLDWWSDRPLSVFRIWAAVILVTGLVLMLV